jgi:pyruvate dehydrogenase E2 component (dihydrolipoamide acetyltransferase)
MLVSQNIAIKEMKPFDLQRKIVSFMTSSSWKEVPLVSYLYEPDVTDFYEEYLKLSNSRKKSTEAQKITFNTLLLKTLIEGLLASPELNSLLEYSHKTVNGRLYICDDINISLPWMLADGRMITPIIAKANKMSLDGISMAISIMKQRIDQTNIDELFYSSALSDTLSKVKRLDPAMFARIYSVVFGRQKMVHLKGAAKKQYYSVSADSHLTEKDLMDGTVTISNIGSLYREQHGAFSLLEVLPPQVFAIGVSAVQEKPGVFVDGDGNKQIGIRKFLPFCLAFDHRAVDFDVLIPFLKRLDGIFTHPVEIQKW